MSALLGNTEIVNLLDELMKKLDPEERELLIQLVHSVNDPAELLSLLEELNSFDYKWRPVDMETFILSPDYLNLRGQVYPKLMDDLIELFEGGYHEAVLTGAIGWGKSTFAEIALARMVYETSCLRNPQQAYGLMDGSTIAFINASVNLKQAEKVVFEGLKKKILRSPYFREQFPFDADLKKEMRFPQNILIMPVAGSEGGTIGYNVLGGVMDEVNFWNVVEKSSLNRGQKYDQARSVYTMLIRRMKSRFNKGGKLPGILLQVSSSKYPDDFTEARIKEVQETGDTKTFVRRYSTWATKPASMFSDEHFYVYIGSTADKAALSRDRSDFADKDQTKVIEVPMDFWNDFNTDLDGSIRDLAGFPRLSIAPFIPQKDKIADAIERGRRIGKRHPFSVIETTLEDGAHFIPELLRFDPTRRYYAHVDLSLKKDSCGLAVGHVRTWKTVRRRNNEGNLIEDVQPVIEIDLMLRISAPPGGEIQVDYVRGLLLELREYGCNFQKITYDQYQSASSIQAFQRMGIESDKLSVDKSMEPYDTMKEAILEDRLILYEYEPFVEEAVRLEKNEQKNKVDHPPKGSKDVTDAVAGVCYHCTLEKMYAQVDPSYGELDDGDIGMVPPTWIHPARGWEPVIDEKGRLRPGKRRLTIDEILFGEAEDSDESEYFFGFA